MSLPTPLVALFEPPVPAPKKTGFFADLASAFNKVRDTVVALNAVDVRVTRQGAEEVRLLDHVNLNLPDHTAGFQDALDAANALGGATVTFPACPLKINGTLNLSPLPGQDKVRVNVRGHGSIAVGGASGRNVFNLIGLRFSNWRGFELNYADGLTDIYGFNFDTRGAIAAVQGGTPAYPAADSVSNNLFQQVNVVLGNGVNNTAFRLGHTSGGNGDLSSSKFDTCLIYGKNNATPGAPGGAELVVAGQRGFAFEGRNTLNHTVHNCEIAYCAAGITTVTAAYNMSAAQYGSELSGGGSAVNGAGAVNVDGSTVFSHNREDILWASVQNLSVSGNSRSENSLHVLKVTDSSDGGDILFDNFRIDDCFAKAPEGFVDGSIIFMGRPSSLKLMGVRMGSRAVLGQANELHTDHAIIMNSNAGIPGVMKMDLGGIGAPGNFVRFGNGVGKQYRQGVQILDANSALTGQFFADI